MKKLNKQLKNHRYLFVFFVLTVMFFLFSCSKNKTYVKSFDNKEKEILQVADSVIKSAYFASLITLDKNNQPRARIVEPFLPEKEYVIWIGTNPKSRKVKQILNNSKATIQYFDKSKLAYVSLMGDAFIVNNDSVKKVKFKKGWDKFYKNRTTDYTLIKFIPNSLELINLTKGYSGDSITWQPHRVVLKR